MVEFGWMKVLDCYACFGVILQDCVVQWCWSPKACLLLVVCSIESMSDTYSGKRDGCRFMPPYSTLFRIRGGIKRPKETAIIKLMASLSRGGICIR